MPELESFLTSNQRPRRLISLSIMFKQKERTTYRWDNACTSNYWTPWLKFLDCIKTLNGVFDGYIHFELRSRPAGWWHPRYWKDMYNVNCSMQSIQMITKINAGMVQADKKLILSVEGLRLHDEHMAFLRFWFRDNRAFDKYGKMQFSDQHCCLLIK